MTREKMYEYTVVVLISIAASTVVMSLMLNLRDDEYVTHAELTMINTLEDRKADSVKQDLWLLIGYLGLEITEERSIQKAATITDGVVRLKYYQTNE